MKDKIKFILIIVIMIVLVLGANFIVQFQGNDEISNLNEKINGDENQLEENIIKKILESEFNKEVIESDKTVIVDFYADWCGPCNQMAPLLEKIARENEDIKIVKINVDEEENLAMTYEIYYLPTFVIMKNGIEVERLVGITEENVILEKATQ